jgi:hypothetical protein
MQREGTYSSSQIYRLMGSASVANNYIQEKIFEKKLKRELYNDTYNASSAWGTYLQHRVINVLLDINVVPTIDIRRKHHTIDCWTGAEDYIVDDSIGEIKCFELKNFCKTHDAASKGLMPLKEICPDIYWQLVSNSILCNKKNAELCLYVPYKKELDVIRDESEWQKIIPKEIYDSKNFQHWLKTIQHKQDEELTFIGEESGYDNISIFNFEIPDSEKEILTKTVAAAATKLQ